VTGLVILNLKFKTFSKDSNGLKRFPEANILLSKIFFPPISHSEDCEFNDTSRVQSVHNFFRF
jgi:hypothetical protein